MQTLDSNPTLKPKDFNSESFLVIDDVCKIYQTPKGPYTVLNGVNLAINEGEFICLIGHSGCGKSTLLNMVAGFNNPSQGEVRLNGKLITEPSPDRMVVFQNYSLLPWLTASENIYLGVESVYADKSVSDRMQIVKEHLELVGLTEAANKKPAQLSGGMKQRVAIARALATRPEVLILDEPFGALDPITREELQEELLKIWEEHKVTVLMITHDIDEALFLSDRIVMMTNGPAAYIGEDLKVPFKRPRNRAQIMEDPQYYELRNYALDFLYRRFAHSEEEEEASTTPQAVPPQIEAAAPLPQATPTNIETPTARLPQPSFTTSNSDLAATSDTKTDATIPFNASKAIKESNMSHGEPTTSSGAKGVLFMVVWLVSMIGLTVINSASVANIKSSAEAEAAATSSTTASAPPSPEPMKTETMTVSPMSAVSPETAKTETAAASPMNAASSAPMKTETAASPMNAASSAPMKTETAAASPMGAASPEAKAADPAKLAELRQKLYDQLNTSWKTTPTFTENLVYHVKVKADGSIIGYETVNKMAADFVKEVPLSTVSNGGKEAAESAGEFEVVFTPTGTLEVKSR